MPTSNDRAGRAPAPAVVISRSFAAPRALVFEAWTTAAHVRRWFCPQNFSVPEAEVDCRPGGAFTICMRAPDGQDHWSRGRFVEVVAPERLAFTSAVGAAEAPGFAAHTTVTFEVSGGGTLLTVTQTYEIFDPAFLAATEGAPEGWRTTLDKLGAEVDRLQAAAPPSAVHASFSLARDYPAPPSRVFRAWAEPAEKARWFGGGEGYTLISRTLDVRPGGRERVQGRWASGLVATFDAIYLDVVPDARLIYAYEMQLDDRKISVSLATVTFAAEGGGTRLTVTEQGAFLDGHGDGGSRENGTGFLLDRLGPSLAASEW